MVIGGCVWFFFFFKQKTAYEMRISDWSSDVCSSDLEEREDRRDEDPDVVQQLLRGHPFGHVLCERRCGHGQQTRAADRRYGEQLPSHVSSSDQIGRASCRERVCQYV